MPASDTHITDLNPIPRASQKVVILGAGLAGLSCAYELERAGYECTVLEASHRIGGRILTLRGGDTVDEMGYSQRCEFDTHEDLYFNAGPSRVPIHHHLLMHYLRSFKVPLEVFTNDNRN
ncbi:MAG TPA: FAD-dependent oxidoreductase, partial [Gammaproteobacteria bacterium]|nr:FAD-dependent oxidoreductase [Gammaproteobacteria bacterium]